MSSHDLHKNTFCDNAGQEEYAHLQRLIDDLSDVELQNFVDAIGITFQKDTKDIARDVLEGVVDEVDREAFYREYYKIVDAR